ncbi:hypothetical protein MIR68_008055 [Amoeboaphelidium protococcarum]|nr:hypothetical protein MIR68_008055 [Amoeboaphelidium protococcarum]
MTQKVHNFTAGPSKLPEEVLQRVQSEISNFDGKGCSVMEISHRDPSIVAMVKELTQTVYDLYQLDKDQWAVCWMSGGGATLQFSAWLMNLLHDLSDGGDECVDFIITGCWSQKAFEEARCLIGDRARCVVDTMKVNGSHNGHLPPPSEWKWSIDGKQAKYVYYCSNETVHGVEWPKDANPLTVGGCPYQDVMLVSDISSNALSRQIPKNILNHHALLYGGVQKNIGLAGLTMIIVRKSLLELQHKHCLPVALSYKVAFDNDALYNTPNVWSIYVSNLVLQWIKNYKHDTYTGLEAIEQRNLQKSTQLYDFLDSHSAQFECPVSKAYRSRMNVVFRIRVNGAPDFAVEKKTVMNAEKQANLIGIGGHRSVGGLRASLYNAVSLDDVQALIDYLKQIEL